MMTAQEMMEKLSNVYPHTLPDETVLELLHQAECRVQAEMPLGYLVEELAVGPGGKIALPDGVTPYMVAQVKGWPLTVYPGKNVAHKRADGVYLLGSKLPVTVAVEYRPATEKLRHDSPLALGEQNSDVYLYFVLAKLELFQGNIGGYNNYSALLQSSFDQLGRDVVKPLTGRAVRFYSEV